MNNPQKWKMILQWQQFAWVVNSNPTDISRIRLNERKPPVNQVALAETNKKM
jgi:hypothetical protein